MSEPDDKRLHGWKEIAAALGVSVSAAKERIDWPDPLPVRWGHRGPWAWRSAIRDWVHRQDMDYRVARQLGRFTRGARGERLPANPTDASADTRGT